MSTAKVKVEKEKGVKVTPSMTAAYEFAYAAKSGWGRMAKRSRRTIHKGDDTSRGA